MTIIINRKNRHDANTDEGVLQQLDMRAWWTTSIEQGNTKVEKKGKSLHERTFTYLEQRKQI